MVTIHFSILMSYWYHVPVKLPLLFMDGMLMKLKLKKDLRAKMSFEKNIRFL